MQIEAINARVASQSGHVIARERRESGIIPQIMPVANVPAVIPAAINPEAVVNVQRRSSQALNQIEDDPLVAAILRATALPRSPVTSAAAALSTNYKVQQEARSIELANMMSQYTFCCKLPDTFPDKDNLCSTLAKKIVGFEHFEQHCCVCQQPMIGESHIAKLPCCSQNIHTNCLMRIPASNGARQCPLCRHVF
jgi:hypothetical protein